jgi:DNA-binding CsgD family transcriptional regulator
MKLQECHEVAQASDISGLETRMVQLANDLDFEIISGALVIESPGGRSSLVRLGNTPQAFQSLSQSESIGKRDPVWRRLKRDSAPFIYDQTTYVNEHAGDLWEDMAAFGYKTGIAMALHLPRGLHFLLGVDRERALPEDDLRLTRMIADFHLLAAHAQIAALRLLGPKTLETTNELQLTSREIEILKWTAEGKSAWAVGQILSTSENNVNYHVKRMLTKLGVATKHQAAARARWLGLI